MEKSVMNNAPRVSVIMGVYNGARFLREAVDSVLVQSYANFEFIICDDCSVDHSAAILEEYQKKDSRIVLLHNEKNMGLAVSLNKCIQVARGEFLARMDCDDRSLPERFEKQVQWLEAHPDVSVVGTLAEYIDDSGNVIGKSTAWKPGIYDLSDAVRFCQVAHPSVMMRREVIQSLGGYVSNTLTTRAEDYDLWCRICEKGEKIANLEQVLFQYREDKSNLVKRKYKHRMQEFQLKWYWIRRTKQPVSELRYAIKPLLVGMLPVSVYKWLHFRKIKDS